MSELENVHRFAAARAKIGSGNGKGEVSFSEKSGVPKVRMSLAAYEAVANELAAKPTADGARAFSSLRDAIEALAAVWESDAQEIRLYAGVVGANDKKARRWAKDAARIQANVEALRKALADHPADPK